MRLSDFPLYKNLSGVDPEHLISEAVSMNQNEFHEAMKKKKKEKYIVTTQNFHRCTQNCRHCFMVEAPTQTNRSSSLTEEDVANVFSMSRDEGYLTYMYYQEPMLREDYFKQLLSFEQSTAEIHPSFFLRKEYRDLIEKSSIREIKHSLHGDVQAHCELTGTTKSQYRDLINGMRIIKEMGLRLGVESTFYTGNAECINELTDTIDRLNVDDWYIGRVMPVGNAKNWDLGDFLRGDSASKLLCELGKAYNCMARKPYLKLESGWGPNFYSTWYYRYLLGEIEGEVTKSTYYCDAIDSHMLYLSVETGKIFPCFYYLVTGDEAIGKYNSENGKLEYEKRKDDWKAESLRNNLQGICSRDTCKMHDLCLGGCRGEAYSFARKLGKSSNDSFFSGMDYCLTHAIEQELSNNKD